MVVGGAALCVAGMAQSHIRGTIAHPWSFCVAGGRRLTHGTGWRPWARFRRALVARDAAALCVAGVALGDIHFRFATSAWQAGHLVTSTLISRGRRGTIAHPRSFCVAGVVQMALGGALGLGLGARDARDAAPLLRGRRGTW